MRILTAMLFILLLAITSCPGGGGGGSTGSSGSSGSSASGTSSSGTSTSGGSTTTAAAPESLADRLDAIPGYDEYPEELVIAIEEAIDDQMVSGMFDDMLEADAMVPGLTLTDSEGAEFDLYAALEKGPVVLAFLKGRWDPYTTALAQALNGWYPQFKQAGAEVVGIVPQPASDVDSYAFFEDIEYPLLADPEGEAALDFGVAYEVSDTLAAAYDEAGIDIAAESGMEDGLIIQPLPAVYIIDSSGLVAWMDYTFSPLDMPEPEELLGIVKELQGSAGEEDTAAADGQQDTTATAAPLSAQLDEMRAGGSAEMAQVRDEITMQLEDDNIVEYAIGVGDEAPDFALEGMDGSEVWLADELTQGPVVLVFFRGGWCPYCHLQLQAFETQIDEIRSYGAEVIAITPELPENYEQDTAKDEMLSYAVAFDDGGYVMDDYGLSFELPEGADLAYQAFGLDVAEINGMDGAYLPVPATYVIDTAGEVRFAEINPDYTYRASPEDVLEVLADM